jgi:hypothetical protein
MFIVIVLSLVEIQIIEFNFMSLNLSTFNKMSLLVVMPRDLIDIYHL